MIEIRKIGTDHPLFKDFLELPFKLYPGKVDWVPPFLEGVAMELSPGNIFFKNGECQLFVALGADQTVCGRVVASVDHSLRSSVKTGHVGYFEAIDDQAVARGLFRAAEEWLRGKGMEVVQGPLNLNIFTGYRLQLDSFDREAYLGEPRSMPYYQDLFRANHYVSLTKWKTFELEPRHVDQLAQGLAQKSRAVAPSGSGYRIVSLDASNYKQEIIDLYPLCMETFSENFGYAEMGLEEFLTHYLPLQNLLVKDYFLKVLDQTGRAVAFAYSYPNRASDFRNAGGTIQKYRPGSDLDGTVLCAFGILKEHRRTSIAYDLIVHTLEAMKRNGGRKLSYFSLTKDGKTALDHLDCTVRNYEIYQKPLKA